MHYRNDTNALQNELRCHLKLPPVSQHILPPTRCIATWLQPRHIAIARRVVPRVHDGVEALVDVSVCPTVMAVVRITWRGNRDDYISPRGIASSMAVALLTSPWRATIIAQTVRNIPRINRFPCIPQVTPYAAQRSAQVTLSLFGTGDVSLCLV